MTPFAFKALQGVLSFFTLLIVDSKECSEFSLGTSRAFFQQALASVYRFLALHSHNAFSTPPFVTFSQTTQVFAISLFGAWFRVYAHSFAAEPALLTFAFISCFFSSTLIALFLSFKEAHILLQFQPAACFLLKMMITVRNSRQFSHSYL